MQILSITKPNYAECTVNDKIIESKTIIDNKLFHGDILNDNYSLKYSDRNNFLIGGVLRLHNKYTFGLNDKGVELFEFQPINWRYPKFLVPSNIKRNLLKAKEKITDQFIVIKYKNWNNKLPIGFIELHFKNQYDLLFYYYPTMSLIKPASLEVIPKELKITINDEIYSIDPEGCKDIDDALSYDFEKKRVGIHISDTDEIIKDYKFNKYATIYAPHKNIPMFPENLSNDLCSLLEGKSRNVITCWINEDNTFEFEINIIQVTKNLSYEQAEDLKLNNKILKILYEKSITMGEDIHIKVTDTHKMVEVFMILYNTNMAKILKDNPKMIYRNQQLFCKAFYDYQRTKHQALQLDYYTHASSPIRRYVDWIIQKLFKKQVIEIQELDKINDFEVKVKKLYRMWDYLKASTIIQNGKEYEIELKIINEIEMGFFCKELNIMIYNKIIKPEYKIGEIYKRKLYLIDDNKHVLFFKILIQF